MRYVPFWKLSILTLSVGLIIGNSFTCIPPKVMNQYAQRVGVKEGYSTAEKTFLNDGIFIGEVVGCIVADLLVAKVGLKRTLLGVMSTAIALNSIACAPVHYAFLTAMRIAFGFTTAITMMLVPVWAAELADPKRRGILGMLVEIFNCVGIVVAYVITILVNDVQLWFLNLVPCSLFFTFCLGICVFLPESVRQLPDNASLEPVPSGINLVSNTLSDHNAPNTGSNKSESLPLDGSEIHQSTTEHSALTARQPCLRPKEASVRQIFCDRKYRRSLLIALILPLHIMGTGIDAFLDYAALIFEGMDFHVKGLSSEDIGSLIIGIWNFLCSLISLGIVEKKGRRFILLVNSFIAIASLVLFTAIYALEKTSTAVTVSLIVVTLFYILAFEAGIGPCQFIILAECFMAEVRVRMTAIAYMATAVYLNVVLLTFSFLQEHKYVAMAIYLVITCTCTALSWFLIPETKGKTLDEIEGIMMTGVVFEHFSLTGATRTGTGSRPPRPASGAKAGERTQYARLTDH